MQRQEMRTDYRDYIASAHNCRESWQSGIVFADNGPRRIVWQLALAIAMDPGVDLAISLYYYLWWHSGDMLIGFSDYSNWLSSLSS